MTSWDEGEPMADADYDDYFARSIASTLREKRACMRQVGHVWFYDKAPVPNAQGDRCLRCGDYLEWDGITRRWGHSGRNRAA